MKIRKGFTIIELMVAILVFTVGLLSAFALVDSAMSTAINGRNEIIAANLAREQIELLKNQRDSNWLKQRDWNSLQNADGVSGFPPEARLSSGVYIVENSNNPAKPVYFEKVNFSWEQGKKYKPDEIQAFALCFKDGKYTHECLPTDIKMFYSFVLVEDLKMDMDNVVINNAFSISSVIISTQRGYREYVIRTILTDWKR